MRDNDWNHYEISCILVSVQCQWTENRAVVLLPSCTYTWVVSYHSFWKLRSMSYSTSSHMGFQSTTVQEEQSLLGCVCNLWQRMWVYLSVRLNTNASSTMSRCEGLVNCLGGSCYLKSNKHCVRILKGWCVCAFLCKMLYSCSLVYTSQSFFMLLRICCDTTPNVFSSS